MRDYWILIRPRIVAMVLFAMAVAGWTVGTSPPRWPDMANALFGTGLVIAGAIALNQRLERRGDAKMPRTAQRPLPSGRLSRRQVTWFGLLTSAIGIGYLAVQASPKLALLAALGWGVYVWAYTPLKSLSSWQTPVGAVAGAMPVLLGAAAADAAFSLAALTLFGIVYFWQLPHSMAIAWLYRHEFAAAKVRLATVVDPSGRVAGVVAVSGAIALLPVSLALPAAAADAYYLAAALIVGITYLVSSACFLRYRSDTAARWLLRASLIYLPVLFAALLL